MTQKPHRVRIKMCGMTRKIDIAHAVSIGVDAIGLIFYEKSSRHVNIEQARLLLQNIPAFLDVVAVFVNAEVSFVRRVITELPIQLLQFHGEETPAFCEQFHKPYIKAIPATSADVIMELMSEHQHAAAVLIDTPSIQHGGTGQPFDWQRIPRQLTKPYILAGGLDANNVVSALAACSPYAVDVCSGVEVSAGIKDHEKMNSFVNVLREGS
jgi:phosphoribosylanthranilate isomerase